MRMLGQEDVEAIEREVRLWFKRRGISPRGYMNLPLSSKVLLCGQVCGRTHAEIWQLRDLWGELLPFQTRGTTRYSPTDEELQKFFSPLTPSESLLDWEKF